MNILQDGSMIRQTYKCTPIKKFHIYIYIYIYPIIRFCWYLSKIDFVLPFQWGLHQGIPKADSIHHCAACENIRCESHDAGGCLYMWRIWFYVCSLPSTPGFTWQTIARISTSCSRVADNNMNDGNWSSYFLNSH